MLRPFIKHIVNIGDQRGVLLRADACDINKCDEILSSATLELIKQHGGHLEPYTLQLDYSFWKSDDILRAVLPEHLLAEIPSGFSQAGHVAHINLRDEFKPFGKLIGDVIIDKNAKIETVVDKINTIDTKFRTFPMKVLSGKDDLVVEQSESGCRFRFDFSKVYWNSRLSTEHERLIAGFQPGDAVCDVFAGVGPFAVPAGKKRVIVLANDLNPLSYESMNQNIALNHTEKFVSSFNLDGRAFIRDSPKLLFDFYQTNPTIESSAMRKRRRLGHESKTPCEATDAASELKAGSATPSDVGPTAPNASSLNTSSASVNAPKLSGEASTDIITTTVSPFFKHYVMNLPDSALTFLDEFIGLYSRYPEIARIAREHPDFSLPIINVHCFEKYSNDEPEPLSKQLHQRVHAKVCALLDHEIPFGNMSFHLVRKVAPTKPMYCVTFQLPEAVAFKKLT